MGREIRRVPANWEHPRYTADTANNVKQIGQHIPLFDNYDKALQDFAQCIADKGLSEAIEYHGGGPQKDSYTQYNNAPLAWWQVYETVTEGTPVSPAFATPEELVEYLVANGDFWDQKCGEKSYSRARAEAFVKSGWAPSGMSIGGTFYTGVESLTKI